MTSQRSQYVRLLQALRAGVITDPYSFDVPTTFKSVPISNTMTGEGAYELDA
jgi:hypothetical protein